MPATPACILIAEQEVGPYYIDGEVLSQNIPEGRPGLPLTLRVALVDAKRCSPLSHAAQGIWHCDALGVNCGFTANSPDGRGGPRTSPDADAGCSGARVQPRHVPSAVPWPRRNRRAGRGGMARCLRRGDTYRSGWTSLWRRLVSADRLGSFAVWPQTVNVEL